MKARELHSCRARGPSTSWSSPRDLTSLSHRQTTERHLRPHLDWQQTTSLLGRRVIAGVHNGGHPINIATPSGCKSTRITCGTQFFIKPRDDLTKSLPGPALERHPPTERRRVLCQRHPASSSRGQLLLHHQTSKTALQNTPQREDRGRSSTRGGRGVPDGDISISKLFQIISHPGSNN